MDEINGTQDLADYREEEYLVYADFESFVMAEELDVENLDIKVIGIDAENPIIEINGKIFRGTYDLSMGTNLFFEKDVDPITVDPLYEEIGNSMFKCSCQTKKILKMERIFIENAKSSNEADEEESMEELKERLQVKMTYEDALSLLLPPGGKPPKYVTQENGNSDDDKSKDKDYDPIEDL